MKPTMMKTVHPSQPEWKTTGFFLCAAVDNKCVSAGPPEELSVCSRWGGSAGAYGRAFPYILLVLPLPLQQSHLREIIQPLMITLIQYKIASVIQAASSMFPTPSYQTVLLRGFRGGLVVLFLVFFFFNHSVFVSFEERGRWKSLIHFWYKC